MEQTNDASMFSHRAFMRFINRKICNSYPFNNKKFSFYFCKINLLHSKCICFDHR